MNEFILKTISADLVPSNYLSVATDACINRDKQIKVLLEKKKLPDNGWDNATIEYFINELALMDSNNFPNRCGVGEREARLACDLVRRRHYNFAHGIGRSGNLSDAQPKAAGSTILNNLTNALVLDLIRSMGISSCKRALLVPLATGMTVMMTLLSLKAKRQNAEYVLWSRIDQQSCFKSIQSAGLTPIVIDTVPVEETGDPMLGTDLETFRNKISELGAANVCCVIATTSCFAPRTCDNIVELAQICQEQNIPLVVNNAYGLQSTYLTHQLEQANKKGRIDAFVQSTDKNLLVPVGGAIVAGFNRTVVDNVSKFYPGRASSSQSLDVLMTLLSMGKFGYKKLVAERKELHQHLLQQMNELAKRYDQSIISGKNPISIAFTLNGFGSNQQMIGSMLHKRGVSGCRVVTGLDEKCIENVVFKAWGSHQSKICVPYLTASAALGINIEEINCFISKLEQVLNERKRNEVSL